MYGIYDDKLHTLVERNLPAETAVALIGELSFDYPDDVNGRFRIVKQVDQGWLCTESVKLVSLEGAQAQ